jgi:hypothetical protein
MLHTIVVDNFFDNIDKVITLSKNLKYHSRPSYENWPGIRTESLHSEHYDFFNEVVLKVLSYYYPGKELKYYNAHVAFCKTKHGDRCGRGTRFHQDGNKKIAAVIYLSDGDIKCGTTIFHKKKDKQIIVANKFNTMVAYDGQKYHGFTSLKTVEKERLTLIVFIEDVEVLT